MIKAILPAIFMMASCSAVCAQAKRDSSSATLIANGSLNKTNTSSAYLLNNTFKMTVNVDSLQLNAANNWIYGRQNSVLTNNDFSSILYADLHTHIRHFYYWGLFNYNTSYSLKINNQVLSGAGVAYSIFEHKNAWLNFSDGILYDQSSLLTNDIYHTWRNSFRAIIHLETKFFTFEATDYFQNSLSNSSDYIIRTNTTAGLKLTKWLIVNTSLTYNKMNITHSYNLIYAYGLTINKRF